MLFLIGGLTQATSNLKCNLNLTICTTLLLYYKTPLKKLSLLFIQLIYYIAYKENNKTCLCWIKGLD